MTEVSLLGGGEATEQAKKQQAPRKAKVNHVVWVDNLELAREMGVDVRGLCGVWVKPWKRKPDEVVEVVGDLVPLHYKRDCRNCARIYDAHVRRHWEAKQ